MRNRKSAVKKTRDTAILDNAGGYPCENKKKRGFYTSTPPSNVDEKSLYMGKKMRSIMDAPSWAVCDFFALGRAGVEEVEATLGDTGNIKV